MNIDEFLWDWITGSEQRRWGRLQDYKPINHSCFTCFLFDVMATKPSKPLFYHRSANKQTLMDKNHTTHANPVLQVELSYINSTEAAGETPWASASNSSSTPPLPPQTGVCGRQRTHQTHLKPQPQLSGQGPPKQWCNTQQTCVTNLCLQFLTLKRRGWRPWEHLQQQHKKIHWTVIQSVHTCTETALTHTYNNKMDYFKGLYSQRRFFFFFFFYLHVVLSSLVHIFLVYLCRFWDK